MIGENAGKFEFDWLICLQEELKILRLRSHLLYDEELDFQEQQLLNDLAHKQQLKVRGQGCCGEKVVLV